MAAPDAGSMPEPAEVPGWTAFERGAFMFGRCDGCGFQTPGRRAQYSLETDMRAHTLLCRSAQLVDDLAKPTPPSPAAVDS